jgi:DNA-binding MarR family transcriptional regulator
MRPTRICGPHGWHRAGIPPSYQRRRAGRLTDSSVRPARTRMSEPMAGVSDEITLNLTPAQVREVLRQATGGEGIQAALSGLTNDSQLMTARAAAQDDVQLSSSLLLGLMVLRCFPADGSELRVLDVAQRLGLTPSTTHRYLKTLVAAGLLDQNPATRRYRRPATRRSVDS